MDNLQYLHNTLLEYKLLDKSFEEFKAASSDKSYQQKVFQETSNRGMFDGSFVDFQNKYFPTQAATTTPASTTPTYTSTSRSRSKSKPTTSKREEPTFVNSEFWKNQRHERGSYTHKEGRWYYTNPEDLKDVRTLTKGPILEELQKEREAELDYKRSKLELEKDILDNKEDKTDEDTKKQLEIDNQLNSLSTKTAIDEEEENKRKKEQGKLKMPKLTKDTTEKDDESAVEELNRKYGEYGFTFRVNEDWKDQVFVTSNYDKNGKFVEGGVTETFTFDQGAIFDDDEKNSAEAKRMDKWMRERAVKQSSAKTLQGAFAKTKTKEEIKQKTVKNLNYYDQVRDAFSNYELTPRVGAGPTRKGGKADKEWRFKTTDYYSRLNERVQSKLDELSEMSDEELKSWIDRKIGSSGSRLAKLSALDSHNYREEEEMLEKIHDILVKNGLSGKGFYSKPDVIKETDQAVENGILGTAISRWERETGLEFDEKNPEHNSAVLDLRESIKQEWKELRDSDDEEAMLESDIYNNILSAATNVTKSFNIRKNIRDYAEDQDGNVFWKGASQKLSAEKAEKEFDKLKQESKDLLNEQSAIEEAITVSDKKLKETLKWFEDNDIDAQIKEIRSKKYTTQEEANIAQGKIDTLINTYNEKLEDYNNAKFNLEQTVIAGKSLQRDFAEIIENREDFQEISKYLNQNYQWGTWTIKSLGDAGVDLLQSLGTAAETIANLPGLMWKEGSRALLDYAALNPDSSVGKFVNSPVINSGLHATEKLGDFYTNSRFDDDPNTRSLPQKLHDAIDKFQESNIFNAADPTAFGEIDGWGDFGKWTVSMLAGQAPQLAMLIASGGSSTLTQTALLTTAAGGQKFSDYEKERDKYLESGGLYGKNYSFGNMILSSTAVGLAEALSERITYGQIKGVTGGLRKANLELLEQQVKGTFKRGWTKEYMRGYFQHMGRTVLNPKMMAYAGYQRLEEGVSESVATISENLIGIYNGEDISIWDNVDQAFVSGAIMSQAIGSRMVFHHMVAPFRSANTQGVLDRNIARMDKILQNLHTNDYNEKKQQELVNEYKDLKEESMKVMELDVKRVDSMNEFEKGKLIEIHKNKKRIEKEAWSLSKQLEDGEITQEQHDQRWKELNNQYNYIGNQKQTILDQHEVNVIHTTYEQTMNSMRERAKEIEDASEGSLKIDIQEGNDGDLLQWQLEHEDYTVEESDADGNPMTIIMGENTRKGKIKEFRNQLNDPNLTAKERSIIERNLKVLESSVDIGMSQDMYDQIMQNRSNYGAFIPEYDNDGNYIGQKIFINTTAAHDGGEFSIAAHEFLHGLLYSTLKGDMRTQNALTETLLETLERKGVKIPEKVMAKIKLYAQDGTRGEEILAVLSQAISDGEVKLPKTALGGIKNFFRRWGYNHNGVAIEFDSDQDVINFLKDYNYSMNNNKQNKALTNMFINGASGKLIEKQQRYRELRKKYRENTGERNKKAMFSQNINQELKNNPDLLTEIDAFVKNEDGTPKYTDKNTWINSTDFADAYMYITQKKGLDGLIQSGMVAEGVNTPEALRDFTRKVKDELGERLLKNFDPTKNDSLFGWLTGVSGGMGKSIIYRAKGDVMNKYSKEIKAVSIDRGMTTETGDTFSSQIEGEVDTEMERLETEVITIGKKAIKKSDIDVIFLESVNTDKRIIEAINGVIDSSGINLEGLTYNGTKKNIIQHDGGKPKSKRKPVGKLYKVLDLVSKEFGVDPMRIIKEQDLTNTQRMIARDYIENNAEKLIDMLPEGENRSGDATGVANTVLGEFYIEGDRISMAESGTGKGKKSQTKRTDITKKEFIEFFNKPGTKSDGAIRALIVQAATISANQAIRLNAINKSTDPMSTIALVGDGKSAIMFSKQDKRFQGIGAIDRNLSLEAKSDFWTNIRGFVDQNMLTTSLESIKTALENTYPEKQFPEIYENIDQIAESIQQVIPMVKTPKRLTDQVAEQLVNKLVTTNENQYIKVRESSGSWMSASEAFRDTQRVKEYKGTTTELAQDMFDPNNLEESIAMIYSLKGHLATMGKGYLKRKQLFRTTEEFLENTLGKINGITYTLTKSGGLDTVTWIDPSNKNAKPIKFKAADILSSQSSVTALSEIEAYEKGDTEKFDKRSENEDIAQKTLDHVVKFYSDKFNNKEIDNVDLMMVKASLLSGMDSILGRAGKLTYISDEARAEIKRAKKAELTELKPETKLLKEGAYDSELDPEAQDALKRQLKEDAQPKVRYEHAPQRVAVIISMFHENINGDGINDIKEFLKEFQVQIITQEFDGVLNESKLGNALPENTNINTPNILLIRNYNDRTKNDPRIESIKKIRREGNETYLDSDGYVILSEAFKMSGKLINKNRKNTMNFSKAVNQANTIDENTPSRGMSAWDFDDTLATTKSGVRARIPNPDGTPKPKRKVIFLAGGAGSGKSNVVKKLGLEKSGFKVVNSDISLEWLKKNSGLPENMNDLTKEQRSTLGKLQHQARGIAKRKMMKYQGNGDGIVVDGTGGSLNVMKKQVQEYRDAGYDVQMIFVETSLDTALERNKNRKERSLLDTIVRKNHHAVQGNKEAFKELFGDNFAEVSTDNLTMKSPMPQTLVDKVDNFTNSYENRRLDAEEFATEGASILEQGGEFDFSEFNVVTEGAQGPMFKTAMDRAKKFGTEHTYVLTARPQEAAIPIQEFLKSQGLDIPLENITGLGNSTGEAKAEWMLEKFAEGYNDMYFADDAMQNVEAVKYVLDQLDIKSEVIQAKIQFSKSIKPNTEILLEGINISQTNSINKVKDIGTLTGEGVYNNIMFSKKHRGEYENLLSKHRPELVKEGLISQTIDNMFDYIDSLNLPDNKKRKYEKITTKWLATSNIKLNEDAFKIKDAVELAEKHKEDIFSYNNPNEIIEKYAGKAKAKPTNPNKVEEFGKGMIINGKYNIVAYEVQDTKEGMHAVREVVDTHFGPKSNPWCIISRSDKQAAREQYVGPEVVFGKQKAEARKRKLESEGFRVELKNEPVDLLVPGKEGPIANRYKLRVWETRDTELDRMDDAWTNWMVYRDGPKRIIFQDGKLIGFYANDQYWDRMDSPTDAPVITKKKDNVTEKVELVPTGQLGQVQEFVIERRTVSEDKKTVTTEILHETQDGYARGTKIVENRVNGTTVKKTRYGKDGAVQEVVNYDKKGKVTSNFTYYPKIGLSGINKFGMPFGEMSRGEIVKTKGDIIESMGTAYNVREAWHAEVLFKGEVAEVGIEIGKDVKIDDLLKTSPDGEIRLDLNKVLEADMNARFMIPGQTTTTLAGALGNVQFSKRDSNTFNLGEMINSNIQKELDLNRVLEQTKGVKAEARYSDAQAKVQGSKKNPWWKLWVPPSAEDFKGLIYRFVGKGRIGEQQMAFFKKTLFDPFSRAYEAMNNSKQRLEGEYRALLKEFPNVKKLLNEVVYNNFTLGQMIRVYNWNKAGFEIPGLSQRDLDAIVKEVEGDAETLAFANSLSTISNQEAGYTEPGDFWMVENIQSDINKINNELDRAYHLKEWKQNVTKMFGEWKNGRLDGPNMNKIEAIYGTQFREALEDMIWRMEFGSKRQQGGNRLVNKFNNWANQSVGAIMFFNMRSALLQTISSINYLNWTDNNPLKAGLALLNVPQFIKDFTMIFNSDMLKQRRAGNQRGINEAELAEAVAGNKFSPKAIINWLLTKGFLPTQIADSFAIASGGATFYRNRVNTYTKQGMTQEQAESKAWEDFQENTEESQQSSRPDMISQQQASPLGRYILAFKNTPMQYARLTKKAWLDLINGRGDAKTNIGKIIYYMGVQNLIFSGLQAALGALIGGDDEEKDAKTHERVVNSMIDSVLGGLGFGGNAVLTMKNMIMEYNKQNKKGWNADHTYTILKFFSFSPTIGSKGRKLYGSIQTEQYNKDVIKEMSMLDIDNPRWSSIANLISAITNVPLDRLVKKIDNIDAAITEDITATERFALLMGWNTWDLDIKDSDILAVEDEIKEKKKIEREEKKRIKKEEKKKEKEIENEAKEEENKKKEDGRCIAIGKGGERCKKKAESGGYCTIHAKVEQGTEQVQCKKIKSDKTRCKMKTTAKSGYCYYHD